MPDIHLIRPIFWDDRLVAYGAGFLHSSDVGGMVPASISPRAAEIFQEGLRIPPKKLFVRGAVNRDLLDVILANCRIPEQNWGDLQALVAGLATAAATLVYDYPLAVALVLLVGAAATSALDAVGNIPFMRSVRAYERPQMTTVFRTYIDFSDLLPAGFFALLLTFYDFRAVFIAAALLMFVVGWIARYLPKRM